MLKNSLKHDFNYIQVTIRDNFIYIGIVHVIKSYTYLYTQIKCYKISETGFLLLFLFTCLVVDSAAHCNITQKETRSFLLTYFDFCVLAWYLKPVYLFIVHVCTFLKIEVAVLQNIIIISRCNVTFDTILPSFTCGLGPV